MAGEWPSVPLSDVADLLTGHPFKSQYYTDNPLDPRLVGGDNIAQGQIRWENVRRWPRDMVTGLDDYWLKPGDVVLAMDRPWIDAGLKRAAMSAADLPALLIQRTARLRGSDRLDVGFLRYIIGSRAFTQYVLGVQTGTAVPHISPAQIRAFRFPLPPLNEQRRIALILGALDDKIELNRKMNETLEAMARALFKSWFVDFDPVRAKAEGRAPNGMDAEAAKLFPSEFVESELGPIPTGWRQTTLGPEVQRCGGSIQTGPFGSQLHASDYVPSGVPVVMPKDIVGRRVSAHSIARIREADAARLSRHRLEPGDVVYSRRGDVERHALVSKREAGWLCGTGCLLVRPGYGWPSGAFLSFALDHPETRAWIVRRAIGATMPNLNTGILGSVPLCVAPDAVMRAFSRVVDPIQAMIGARALEASSLADARDQLLPRLLAGELDPGGVE
ncbi:MAG: restriction endonuclease subunit S [Deltaproteobacteria bacterium]|nr:restriction endonuclease subunit S [Deltaproteobacteria bacterium]